LFVFELTLRLAVFETKKNIGEEKIIDFVKSRQNVTDFSTKGKEILR